MTATIEITGLRVRKAMAPLRRPLATRVGAFGAVPVLLLDLETRGGGGGRMIGTTFTPLGLKVVPPVLEALAEFAAGKTVTLADAPAFHDACLKRLTLLGHEGVTQMALSMFDMAVYDALARAAGVPLCRLLGSAPTPVRAYNSCGLGVMAAADAAREARELVVEHGGFDHIKMRLGRGDPAAEVAAIRAVREAIGPDVILSIDFNQSLSPSDALETCRAIDGLGLAWIEEPVVYDDYATQARLTRKLATPIQIGENWWSWRVGAAAIEMGACDYIMPDLLRIGGVTGWMRLARIADAHAMPFSSHLSPDVSAHLLAATPTRHWLEFMDWGQDLIRDPLVPDKGVVVPRETPGAGIEWNETAIARHLV